MFHVEHRAEVSVEGVRGCPRSLIWGTPSAFTGASVPSSEVLGSRRLAAQGKRSLSGRAPCPTKAECLGPAFAVTDPEMPGTCYGGECLRL